MFITKTVGWTAFYFRFLNVCVLIILNDFIKLQCQSKITASVHSTASNLTLSDYENKRLLLLTFVIVQAVRRVTCSVIKNVRIKSKIKCFVNIVDVSESKTRIPKNVMFNLSLLYCLLLLLVHYRKYSTMNYEHSHQFCYVILSTNFKLLSHLY